MAPLNNCQFIGRLGADPEIRSMNSGDRVCNLRLAVSETWRDKTSGEKKEKTEWVRVVIFNDGLAKVAESYLRKGSLVFVAGAMQTRKWTDQSGVEKYSTEIILQKFNGQLQILDSKGKSDGDEGSTEGFGSGSSARDLSASPREDFSADLDDSIPFGTNRSAW